MAASNFVTTIPANVQTAIDGLLTDVYSTEMREDIVVALTWGINNTLPVAEFLNDLGLTVWNGKLHVVFNGSGSSDVPSSCVPHFDTTIPSQVQNALNRIFKANDKEHMDVQGTKLRDDIVTVLRWASQHTSSIAGFINDLGLTVVDGKLCVIFYPDTA